MKTPKTGRRLLEQQHESGSINHGQGEDGAVIAEATEATRLAHLAEVAELDHQEEEQQHAKEKDGRIDKNQHELELGQTQENKLTSKETKETSIDGNGEHVVIQPPLLLPVPSGVNEEKFRSFEETRGHLLREDLPQV